MDISIEALWRCWKRFRTGKKRTAEFERFTYHLEENLFELQHDLASGTYRHGSYRTFEVIDPKRRMIAVASVRDRLVHRLLYDELVRIYDPLFLHDVWSCRTGKGLHAALDRSQGFLRGFPRGWVWRADIHKFFDHVDHAVLLQLLRRKIVDESMLEVLRKVIKSYMAIERGSGGGGAYRNHPRGIPIGNVTSQVFANITLHEFDRFVAHTLHPSRYLRYGDDFLLIGQSACELEEYRERSALFLQQTLKLGLHPRNDLIIPVRSGVRFLGQEMFPRGRRLVRRMRRRWEERLCIGNIAGYHGLVCSLRSAKMLRCFHWHIRRHLDGAGDLPQSSRPIHPVSKS